MKILATGTSGTIGRRLPDSVQPFNFDLTSNISAFEELTFPIHDAFIHLAGIVGKVAVERDVNYSRSVNLTGLERLATIFLKKTNSKFIYVSSSHIYSPSAGEISEVHTVDPQNLYAKQKYEAEERLNGIFAHCLDRLVIVRVFSVLDWGMPANTLGDAIFQLSRNNGYVLQNGEDIRDFLTPKTVAFGLCQVALNSNFSGVVNLCSGDGLTVRDAAFRMLYESGFKCNRNNILKGNSRVPSIIGDASKLYSVINRKLAWDPSEFKNFAS